MEISHFDLIPLRSSTIAFENILPLFYVSVKIKYGGWIFVFSYIFKKLSLLNVAFQLITFHSTSVATNYIFVYHVAILGFYVHSTGKWNSVTVAEFLFFRKVSECLTSFYEILFQKRFSFERIYANTTA